jgi:hypothetical protein|uniref:Uncharacterized protein n=1 Tax=Phaeodactylum tricornutum TaxID=2850 RepID=A0A8J9SAA3_PHATR
MISATKGFVVTGTDRIDRERGQNPLTIKERSTTNSKASRTASLSLSNSSLGSDVEVNSFRGCSNNTAGELNNASEKLMRMIAQEMVKSLRNPIYDNSNESTSSRSFAPVDTVASIGTDIDLETLAEMVLTGMDTTRLVQRPDEDLRKMLREGLSDSVLDSPTDNLSCHSQSALQYPKTTSIRSGSKVSQSIFSDSSMNNHSCEAPIDIWNSDVWSSGGSGEDISRSDMHFDSNGNVPSEEEEVNEEQMGMPIDLFLQTFKEVGSALESEDNLSISSDLSGLTGVFSKPSLRANSKPYDILPESSSRVAPIKKKRTQKLVSFAVRFDQVHVRAYQSILSDNPSCTNGPSIGIGWNYEVTDHYSVDDWELERERFRRPSELILDRNHRETLLQSLGYSEKQLAAAVRDNNKIKHQRRQTVNNLGAQSMEEAVEKTRRKLKRLLFLRNGKVKTAY